jgi:hypothetical protein
VGGDELAPVVHPDLAVSGDDVDRARHQFLGHRVAGGAEPHRRELVDLAGFAPMEGRSQRRQRVQERALVVETVERHGGDLGVNLAVDLGAPARSRGVGPQLVGPGAGGNDEVGLGVAAQGLDDTLGLGVSTLTEVGRKP